MKVSTAVVVDSDPRSVRLLDAALRRWRFAVVSTDRASGLLNLLSLYRPALVLLDTAMPGLDGAAIVRFIRSSPELAATTVLFHTQLDEDALARKAHASLADGFIVKSQSLFEVEERLKRWLPSSSTARRGSEDVGAHAAPPSADRPSSHLL